VRVMSVFDFLPAMTEIARSGGPRSPRSIVYSNSYTLRIVSSSAFCSVAVLPLPSGASETRNNVSAALVGEPRVPRNENPDKPVDTTTETFVSPCSETPRWFKRPGGPKAGSGDEEISCCAICLHHWNTKLSHMIGLERTFVGKRRWRRSSTIACDSVIQRLCLTLSLGECYERVGYPFCWE
jgi:hypothetical protein